MAADGITLPHRDVLLTASQVMGELSVVCLWGCQSSSSVCIWEKGRAHSSVDSWSEGNWRMERTFHKLTGLWCNNWMNRVTLSISISHDWIYQQWNIQANVTWLHAPILKTRLHTYLCKQTNYIFFFKSNNMQNKNVQGVQHDLYIIMIMETAYVQRICLIYQERVYASFRVESFSNFYNQSIILFISKKQQQK